MARTRDNLWKLGPLAGTLTVGLALGLLPACSSMSGSVSSGHEDTTASAVRDPVLQDIPKPAGFVLDPERSSAIASGKYRLAKCEYGGTLAPSAVKRFYEEYMPSANFELQNWSLDRGEFTMTFESSSEVCTVRIRPGSWQKTAVLVEIIPKPQGSPEHEPQPPMRRPQ
jgi:hypothetical protein